MRSVSLLYSIKEFERCLDDLHELPRLAGNERTVSRSVRARQLLGHVGRLLQASYLSDPTIPWNRQDADLKALITTIYEQQTTREDELVEVLGSTRLERLRGTNQVETYDGEILVPLTLSGATENWPPVLRFLLKKSGDFQDRVRVLLDKLRADGAESSWYEMELVQSLDRRLDVLHGVVRRMIGKLQLVNYSVSLDAQFEHLVTELLPILTGSETGDTNDIQHKLANERTQ